MAEKKKTEKVEPKSSSRKAPAGLKWIPMKPEEALEMQINRGAAKEAGGKIVGYDPKKQEALVKA